MRIKLIIGLILGFFVISSSPVLAVINGSEILDADISKPWVAQIYYAETTDDYDSPIFICSGSLISENKILTAAHCVMDTGFYFVSLGARTLNSNAPLLEVESVWRNPRYSDRKLVNDGAGDYTDFTKLFLKTNTSSQNEVSFGSGTANQGEY